MVQRRIWSSIPFGKCFLRTLCSYRGPWRSLAGGGRKGSRFTGVVNGFAALTAVLQYQVVVGLQRVTAAGDAGKSKPRWVRSGVFLNENLSPYGARMGNKSQPGDGLRLVTCTLMSTEQLQSFSSQREQLPTPRKNLLLKLRECLKVTEGLCLPA